MAKTGEPAPDFELTADDGETVRLSDLRGEKNVVLAFFPAAFSPVCTAELEGFRDLYDEFEGLDTEVFGISTDNRWSLAAFRDELELPFPLLSDFHRTVSPGFDALYEERNHTRRVIAVVDKVGTLAHLEEFEPTTCPDAAQVLGKVKEIQG